MSGEQIEIKEIKANQTSSLIELQDISRRTFRETFESVSEPFRMESYLRVNLGLEMLIEQLNNINSSFYLIYLDSELIGFLKLNFNSAQTELQDPEAIEIERIYLLKAYQGKGLGAQLMDFALQRAQEAGVKYIWLGVSEANVPALHFYLKQGFIVFGEHTFDFSGDLQTDLMMKRNIQKA